MDPLAPLHAAHLYRDAVDSEWLRSFVLDKNIDVYEVAVAAGHVSPFCGDVRERPIALDSSQEAVTPARPPTKPITVRTVVPRGASRTNTIAMLSAATTTANAVRTVAVVIGMGEGNTTRAPRRYERQGYRRGFARGSQRLFLDSLPQNGPPSVAAEPSRYATRPGACVDVSTKLQSTSNTPPIPP